VRSYRWLGYGLIAMGAGLAANSLLGPLLADVIEYPLSETLLHQTMGLEAVSLVLVAPWAIVAGVLALRGHHAAPILALGPAAYVAYMFVQYIVGPEYLVYPGVLGLHMTLFVVSGALVLLAWSVADAKTLPRFGTRTDRRYAWVLFALGAFVASRYVPGLIEGAGGEPIPPDALEQPTMFWSIFWMDLAIVVPITIATGVALLRGTSWAHKALYAIIGWFALVPPSVAAMSIVMLVNDDPNASVADTLVLSMVTLVFAAIAVPLYARLFRASPSPTVDDVSSTGSKADDVVGTSASPTSTIDDSARVPR
jgi:hypothetical protein